MLMLMTAVIVLRYMAHALLTWIAAAVVVVGVLVGCQGPQTAADKA